MLGQFLDVERSWSELLKRLSGKKRRLAVQRLMSRTDTFTFMSQPPNHSLEPMRLATARSRQGVRVRHAGVPARLSFFR